MKDTLLKLGRIEALDDGTIIAGDMRFDAGRVNVRIDDRTTTTSHVAPIGVFLAVVFLWVFLLSLFFLLIRESRTRGTIFVTVEDRIDGRIWVEPFVVSAGFQRTEILRRFAYLQTIITWRTNALTMETTDVNS